MVIIIVPVRQDPYFYPENYAAGKHLVSILAYVVDFSKGVLYFKKKQYVFLMNVLSGYNGQRSIFNNCDERRRSRQDPPRSGLWY
jgi:hypothetical protein